MVTDVAAAERMIDRLAAVRYDDDKAYAQRESRGRLAHEFLRRTARWALALGAENKWPHSDLATALDPELAVDPGLIEKKIDFDGGTRGEFPVRREIVYPIVHWAALGDLPRQRFPELDDPYEPLLLMFERSGGYLEYNRFLELGYGAFPVGKLAERAELEALPIDVPTLDALDAQNEES
ncbi:hypothetical protein [Kribbella sp. DT2]|uniref:hypothetical protein n=1 Tax=Kribbella sp. DT2 TaxID=3393427 RepID=UPI003CF54566